MSMRYLNRRRAVGGELASATRMPTPALWKNCPAQELADGTKDGFLFWDDFTQNGLVLANNNAAGVWLQGGWVGQTAATAGTTISTITTKPYGVVHLETTTDNEDAIISNLCGKNTAGMVNFVSGQRVWFEARVSNLNITDSKFNFFVGFAEEALCDTTELITASDAMADKDFVGFQRVFADGDKLDIVYNTASGGGATTGLADAVTLVADTFVKVGIYCDGTTVYYYLDGTLSGTTTLLSATNFPNGEEMAFYCGIMAGHGDTCSAEIDWVKVAQEITG